MNTQIARWTEAVQECIGKWQQAKGRFSQRSHYFDLIPTADADGVSIAHRWTATAVQADLPGDIPLDAAQEIAAERNRLLDDWDAFCVAAREELLTLWQKPAAKGAGRLARAKKRALREVASHRMV